MDSTVEEYFGEVKLLLQSKGWGLLREQFTTELQNLNDISVVTDSDDLFYRKGQMLVLSNLLNLDAIIEAAEQSVLDDKAASLEE